MGNKHIYAIVTDKGKIMELGDKEHIRKIMDDIKTNIPSNSGVYYPSCHIEHGIKNILNSTKTADNKSSVKRLIEYYKSNN